MKDIGFLDWVAPPNRASAAQGFAGPISFTVKSEQSERVYLEFARFIRRLRDGSSGGADPSSAKATSALHADIRPEEASARGLSVLEAWLTEVKKAEASCKLVVQFEPGGFILIWFVLTDGDPDLFAIHPIEKVFAITRIENVALVMAHLVKAAVNPDAAVVGAPRLMRSMDDPRQTSSPHLDEIYEVLPTTLEPVRIVTRNLDHDVQPLLRYDILGRMRKRFRDDAPATLFDSDLAVVQLGSRVGQILDDNLPFVGDSSDDQATAVVGFGEKTIRTMSDWFNRTSLSLMLVFLAATFATTVGRSLFSGATWPDPIGLERGEFMVLSAAFFGFCVLRVIAVYGIETLIGDMDEPGWFARRSGWLAGWYFTDVWTLLIDIGLLLGVWAWLVTHTLGWSSWPSSTSGNEMMTGVITGFIWAMPAIGIGLLAHSANKFSTISDAHNDNNRALGILSELSRVAAFGRIYFAHLETMPGIRLPDGVKTRLEAADGAIERAKERVNVAMEARRRKFVRASAITAALIGFVGAVGQISSLEPDHVDTNRPIDIMKLVFGESAPSQSQPEDRAEGFSIIPAALNTSVAPSDDVADPCSGTGFLRELERYAPEKADEAPAETADEAPPELVEGPEELFALAIGHLIKCQDLLAKASFGGRPGGIVADVGGAAELRQLLESLTSGQGGYLRIPAKVAVSGAVIVDDPAALPAPPGTAPADRLIAEINTLLDQAVPARVPASVHLADPSAAANGLDQELAALGPRPVAVAPKLAPDVAGGLDGQLAGLGPRPIPVAPKLTPDAAPDLASQLDALGPAPAPVTPTLAPGSAESLLQQLAATASEAGYAVPVDLVPSDNLVAVVEKALANTQWQGLPGPRPAAAEPIPDHCLAHPLASFYFTQSGRTPAQIACADLGAETACRADLSDGRAPDPVAAGKAIARLAAGVTRSPGQLLAPGTREYLLLVGYTDSTGNAGINLGIARDRAEGLAGAIGEDLERVPMSPIWRGEEVYAAGPAAGVPHRSPLSRRVDVFHCTPEP